MTEFILLDKKFNGSSELKLFKVTEDVNVSYLVQYLNKRLTAKWFNDYFMAAYYFNKHRL